MTGMLASVNSKEEALLVLNANVDIIDLKQPSKGALGALEVEQVADIVKVIKNQSLISATIGDLPMQPDLIFNAVQLMAATGVDYVKIGIFPQGDSMATLTKLAELNHLNFSLIAVLFADALPCLSILEVLKNVGFKGVMLDTMDKKSGSLVQLMDLKQITNFITQAKQQHLLSGLAGSLREVDINKLQALNPDYLGFRGALCQQHNRIAQLNNPAIIRIQQMIKQLAY
ncbi:MAG: (5-formylfuran-3-yl)methyl phosphate synthase [Methylococcales bacterium]|nr:(5-formylfuran-3-yl)methyl phosphate synthase [Methylococcales bacterium]